MAKVTFLVVDADPKFVQFIEQVIEQRGWKIDRASNGLEALKTLEHDHKSYSAVLSSLEMPVMNGARFLHHVRNRGLTLPILLFAEHPPIGLPLELAAITESKSLTTIELLNLLDRLLRRK